ncbi:MAG: carboxypeptidase-like regulatory domain-containing protein, partial [Prevotellaceae bacterium]|nr:carboxypeptidase-like regulatory domain-containing protein [Prevotellaceae bacterium]
MKCFFKVSMLALVLLLPYVAKAQITGQVFDSNNEPVIGATVVEKGNTKNAAITDFDGNFKINVTAGKKIVITYVGMKTQEIAARANMKVVMEDNTDQLDELVVIGYTSKARKDLTGSVGSVSGVKLAQVPVTSAAVALQGKISGVQVTTVDGEPGAEVNIRIRGGSSVTQSNEPLYI